MGRFNPDGGGPSLLVSEGLSSKGLAAFLLRLMAYFHGTLRALPRWEGLRGYEALHSTEGSAAPNMVVIDSAAENSMGPNSEPLMKVRMNRALSRRLRWMMKRGRLGGSGEMRLASATEQARCQLSAGQFIEYCIRVHGQSRIRAYGLGLGRRALRDMAIHCAALQGDGLSLCRAAKCNALLAPD